jgi:hypothetical protein
LAPSKWNVRVIRFWPPVGLSRAGGGRLVLQSEGSTNPLAVPFVPKPGQRYKIDVARDDQEVTMSIDGMVTSRSRDIPFTDLARDVTIGGRPGPTLLALTAAISDVQIARQRARQ